MRAAPIAVGCCVALAAGWYGLGGAGKSETVSDSDAGSFACTVASVHDGDTFTCAERDASGRAIRVRLAGVDARELGDFCARGHPCSPAHADDSTAALSRMALGQRLSCQSTGATYGRIGAFCSRPDGTDLSCAMLQAGMVARWDRYWGGHRC